MYFCIVSLFSPSSYNLFPVWISVRAIFHLFIRLLVHVLLEQGSRNPDLGLSISFFHSVKPEEILKEDLTEMLNNCYMSGKMSKSMRTAIVTLIPKEKNSKLLKNWRPVSLLNIDYKILSKIITKKLQDQIKTQISNEQKCALKGRQISDIHLNILAVLKKMKKNKDPVILTTYDYTKAFDMIDHSIIWTTLQEMKVDETTIKWIQIMYKEITSQIQVNGALTPEILIRRGIRQGCPLSMLLFVIALEAFTRSLKKNQEVVAPTDDLKAQQYADDLNTITANVRSQKEAEKELNTFCEISGLEINNDKTHIVHMNLDDEEKRQLTIRNPNATIDNEIKILGIYFNNLSILSEKKLGRKNQQHEEDTENTLDERCLHPWKSKTHQHSCTLPPERYRDDSKCQTTPHQKNKQNPVRVPVGPQKNRTIIEIQSYTKKRRRRNRLTGPHQKTGSPVLLQTREDLWFPT